MALFRTEVLKSYTSWSRTLVSPAGGINPFKSGRLNSAFIIVFARAGPPAATTGLGTLAASANFFSCPLLGGMGTIARSRTPELPYDDEIAVQRALPVWTKGQAHDCCERPGKPDRDGEHRHQPRHQRRDQ